MLDDGELSDLLEVVVARFIDPPPVRMLPDGIGRAPGRSSQGEGAPPRGDPPPRSGWSPLTLKPT